MIASRSNVLLAFLEIYLIVGFLTISVFSEEVEWTNENREASQTTGCISDCQGNITCQEKCDELTRDQLVWQDYVDPANFHASVYCEDPEIRFMKLSTGNDLRENKIEVTQVNNKTIWQFTNLEAGALYRYKAYRVEENNVTPEPEISPCFITFREVKRVRAKSTEENSSEPALVFTWELPALISKQNIFTYYSKNVETAVLSGNTIEHQFSIDTRFGIIQLTTTIIAELSGRRRIISQGILNSDKTAPGIKKAYFNYGMIVVLALGILAFVLGVSFAIHLRRHSKSKGSHNNKTHNNLNSAIIGSRRNAERNIYTMEPVNLEFKKKSLPLPKDRLENRSVQLKIENNVLVSDASGTVRLGCYQNSENHATDLVV